MAHILSFGRWLVCLMLLAALPLRAEYPTDIITTANPLSRNPKEQVSDLNKIISDQDRYQLNLELSSLDYDTGVEAIVVILLRYDREHHDSARDFAYQLFNYWGIGSAETGRGLLLVLFVDEDYREVAIEVGTGLEEVLPDELAAQIIREHMLPHFSDGHYAAGLNAGMAAIRETFDGMTPLPADERRRRAQILYADEPPPLSFKDSVLLLAVALAGGALYFGLRHFLTVYKTGTGKRKMLAAFWLLLLAVPSIIVSPLLLIIWWLHRMSNKLPSPNRNSSNNNDDDDDYRYGPYSDIDHYRDSRRGGSDGGGASDRF